MTLAREAHRRARALLAANRDCLDDLAANALERETLTREDLDEIFAAHELRDAGPSRSGSGAALVAMARNAGPARVAFLARLARMSDSP